jgi:DNA polymerase-3 subunit delta
LKAKKPTFKDYQSQLKAFKKGPLSLTMIYGPSQFLMLNAIEDIKTYFKHKGIAHHAYDAKDLDADAFTDLYESSLLFSQAQSPIIQRFEKQTSLFKYLSLAQKNRPSQQHTVLCFNSEKIPVKALSDLEKDNYHQIACFPPNYYELPDFVKDLAKRRQLSLSKSAIELLIEALGQDLFKIANELTTISLIYAAEKQDIKSIDAEDIKGYLSYLREDHLFEFDNYLLRGATAKSLYLLDDLLQRGESPLAILGLISHHCRKALIILECLKKGLSDQAICTHAKIPAFVLKNYRRHLNPNYYSRYRNAIRLCQKADIMLKSSRSDSALHLSNILLEITR